MSAVVCLSRLLHGRSHRTHQLRLSGKRAWRLQRQVLLYAGGSLERYSLFGTQTSPRAGVSYYAFRPRKGIFSGTRILFNYGDGVREPKLLEQFVRSTNSW